MSEPHRYDVPRFAARSPDHDHETAVEKACSHEAAFVAFAAVRWARDMKSAEYLGCPGKVLARFASVQLSFI